MTTTDPDQLAAPRRVEFVALVGAVVVLVAGAVMLVTALRPAGARVAGSTENSSSLFSSGAIDVQLEGPSRLLFDADGLYPGLEVERCVVVTYAGSIEHADLRLWGERAGGTGLDRFLDTRIELGTGTDPECDDFEPSAELHQDTLEQLWLRHGTYPDGLAITSEAVTGFTTTVRVAATVVDDDDAQGLDTEFWVTFEARP